MSRILCISYRQGSENKINLTSFINGFAMSTQLTPKAVVRKQIEEKLSRLSATEKQRQSKIVLEKVKLNISYYVIGIYLL